MKKDILNNFIVRKKLKELGYPKDMDKKNREVYWECDSPSIPDLISWLGDNFYQLKRQCNNGHCWFKAESNQNKKSDCQYQDEEYINCKSENLIEAVANLCIKLTPKKKLKRF